MRPRSPLPIARSAALAACMAATLAACSSPAKWTASPGVSTAGWSTTVDRTIPDAARAAKVKALGQQLAELQRSMEAEFAELDQRAAFRKLVRDHGSTAEDFDRLFEQSAAEDVRRVDEIWALRRSVLEQASPDEWSAIMSGAKADAARADQGAKSIE